MQGEDLFLEGLTEPYRTRSLDLIRKNVQHVDAFLAVSEYYAEFMAHYLAIPESKIYVVPLGINLTGYEAVRHPRGDVFKIGYFARVAPEKGLHVLAETYRSMRARNQLPPARLEVAGYLAPEHKPYLQEIEGKMNDAGLANEFRYLGVVDREEKVRFLQSQDVLSVPSVYAEPKGIYLLEAMANGLPVVQPRRGAFPEIIGKTGGGLLVEPDNPDSLAEGLLTIYGNPALADELGRKGADGVGEHYSAARMAGRAVEVFGHVIQELTPASIAGGQH
jgi:glycosyltransferase involved in cell wall biosynthesis